MSRGVLTHRNPQSAPVARLKPANGQSWYRVETVNADGSRSVVARCPDYPTASLVARRTGGMIVFPHVETAQESALRRLVERCNRSLKGY